MFYPSVRVVLSQHKVFRAPRNTNQQRVQRPFGSAPAGEISPNRSPECVLVVLSNGDQGRFVIAVKRQPKNRLFIRHNAAASFFRLELRQTLYATSAGRFGRQLPPLLDSLKQFRYGHPKRVRDDQQRIEPWYALPALK